MSYKPKTYRMYLATSAIPKEIKDTKIISGFPGIGKTVLSKNCTSIILDSDSSSFSWLEPGVRNPDFPNNYIEHIKSNIGKVDYILVSSHKDVRQALEENEIYYTLVYPNIELRDEYLEIYKQRGNDEKFISFIGQNWYKFIEDIDAEQFPNRFILQENQYLSDILEYI